jgi:pantoate--beta-alanine ligase
MSSRNVRLSPDHRAQAPVLAASLADGAAAFADGERSADALVRIVEERLAAAPDGEVDYVTIVDPVSLEPVEVADGTSRLVLAVRFGGTRLLDNAALADPPRLPGGTHS